MYAYCRNNSANQKDKSGHKSYSIDLAEGSVITPKNCTVYTYYYNDTDLPDFDGKQFSYKLNKRMRIYVFSGKDEPSTPAYYHAGDVIVWDKRDHTTAEGKEDPCMKIYDSYSITSKQLQNTICGYIMQYNRDNPHTPSWNHTNETAIVEWGQHNCLFYGFSMLNFFGVFDSYIESARHADLDNDGIGVPIWCIGEGR